MEISPKVAGLVDIFVQRRPAVAEILAQQARRRSCAAKPIYPGQGKSDAIGPSLKLQTVARLVFAFDNFWTAKPGVLH